MLLETKTIFFSLHDEPFPKSAVLDRASLTEPRETTALVKEQKKREAEILILL